MSSSLPTQVSRRTLVRGAAWSVPVVSIAAAAPAFAASPCDAITISSFPMSGGTVGTAGNGANQTRIWSRSLTTGTSTLQLSATSSYSGNMARAADQSPYAHFSTTANAGGTGTDGLQMFQERSTQSVNTPSNHAGTYAYTFDRPVTNLTFTLSDIDYYAYRQNRTDYYQYDDRVTVTSPQGSFTIDSRGSTVSQNSLGTAASPFRPNVNGNIDLDEGSGNVVVKFAGPITNFSITYWNGLADANTASRIQVTLLSQMSFTYLPCA